MIEPLPFKLSVPHARRIIAELSADSERIVVIAHGRQRARQRHITRRQIEQCVQKGVIIEGPHLNSYGNWQLTMQRRAGGEELQCVVVIDWPHNIIVITTY